MLFLGGRGTRRLTRGDPVRKVWAGAEERTRTRIVAPMELRHLRYFIAVAEELHFARAAARLNIAPPTLSAQIQQLETALGARLFTRKTRSVARTQVGKRFLEEARLALKQVEHAELVGRRAAKGEMGSIA